jgi:serine/threonine-protein kinase HipA
MTKLTLAMAVRGTTKHYRVATITRRHFNATAQQCGLGADMEPVIADVVSKTPAVIEKVGASLPKGFPAGLFDSVTTGLKKAATQIEQMSPR